MIQVIFSRKGGKDTIIDTKNDILFSELVEKYRKINCISKRIMNSLQYRLNGNKILSFNENLQKLSIKNKSNIVVESNEDINMKSGKDNWKDGIIGGKGQFSFLSEKEKKFIFDSLKNNVKKIIKMKLYSATEDGDTSKSFHQRCDNKGPLFYLIKTTNDAIFGIYVSKSISSENVVKADSQQMIICPYQNYAILSKSDNNSTYHCYADKGALFHCIQINTPFLSSDCIDIKSCDNFDLPNYPSGNSSYKIKNLEVYSLEDLP